MHSIKGGAGAFGLDDLVRFAHVFETALEALRGQRLSPEPPTIRVFLRAADLLADLVREAHGGATVDPGRSPAIEAELASLGHEPTVANAEWDALLDFQPVRVETSPPRSWRIRFRPHASLYARGNDPLTLLRELGRLGVAETTLDLSALPSLEALDPEAGYLSWTVEVSTDQTEQGLREVFEFVDGDCDLEIAPAAPHPAQEQPPVPIALPEPLKCKEPTPASASAALRSGSISTVWTGSSISSANSSSTRPCWPSASASPASAERPASRSGSSQSSS